MIARQSAPGRLNRRAFLQTATAVSMTLLAQAAPALAGKRVTTQKPAPFAGKRYALLIAVNGYQQNGDTRRSYEELNTLPDILVIQKVLAERYQFRPAPAGKLGVSGGDFTVLKSPAETTHQSILKAFDDLAAKVKPNDIVYIHYSGHGSYVFAPNGEKRFTIVPSDYRDVNEENSSQHNEIKDTDLSMKIKALRTALQSSTHPGSSLTLSFDCCHSGELLAKTRAKNVKVRTRNPEYPVPKPTAVVLAAEFLPATCPAPGKPAEEDSEGAIGQGMVKERGFCAILACRFNQFATELEPDEVGDIVEPGTLAPPKVGMGRLSLFLARALMEAREGATYGEILSSITAGMTSRFDDQNPVMEWTSPQCSVGIRTHRPGQSDFEYPPPGRGGKGGKGKVDYTNLERGSHHLRLFPDAARPAYAA